MPAASNEASTPKGSPHSRRPSYLQMIVFSMIDAQKEHSSTPRKGISMRALKSKIVEKYADLVASDKRLNRNLHQLLDENVLTNTKGVGLSGSVRFHHDFSTMLKKLGDDPTEKEISDELAKYLKTVHVHGSADESDDGKSAEKKKRTPKKAAAEPKPKKGEKAAESATTKPKAKKTSDDGSKPAALVTGKASKKRAAAEKSVEEPKSKKSK